MRTLTCERCGQRVFFENLACESCGAALGFVPAELRFGAFEIDANGLWQRLNPEGRAQKPCSNYLQEQVCNWMLPADSPASLCLCCQTTHIIPALSKPENRAHWAQIERAKRRLFYSLVALRLPAPSKDEDPAHGLSFQFLEQVTPQERVLTGHDNGVITLNIAEADDSLREQIRAHMHEPYRTLLGHFRHEIGHYYWDRLLPDSERLAEYRRLFGDERADYGQALQQHYSAPLVDWRERFISSYASAHPWEDWAECWAHYMHIQDGLESASAWGLQLAHALPGGAPVVARALAADAELQPALIEQWLPISQFINAMDRSLGAYDSYPFAMPTPVIEKLDFIHRLVGAAASGALAMRFSTRVGSAE
jgi:hypothetical protein